MSFEYKLVEYDKSLVNCTVISGDTPCVVMPQPQPHARAHAQPHSQDEKVRQLIINSHTHYTSAE
jgi:hypothetical protein